MARSANPPKIATEFGRRVRERREALGWSQMRLAEVTGMHFTYISDTERGLRNVSLANIAKLASALDVDAGDLVAGMADAEVSQRRRVG